MSIFSRVNTAQRFIPSIVGLTAGFALLYAQSGAAVISPKTDKEMTQASIEIINQLKLSHYRYVSLDNDFSSKLFDKYLAELDPQRAYFLHQDIDGFEQYRHGLDNALNRGDLAPGFSIFVRYQERAEARLRWVIRRLEAGIDDLDFSDDDSLEIDREQAPWATSVKQLDELWLKRIENNVLNLKLANKKTEDIAELLVKRYKNQLKRLQQTNKEDVFQLYMNVVAKSYDPHTEYFAPRRSENFNINMSLSLEGIGAVLQSDQEYTKIVRLIPGGPADGTGQLSPTDRIVGVAQEDGEMVDVVGWRLDEVVDLIRGKKGTKVTLSVIPKDATNDNTIRVPIVRNKIQLEEQAAQKEVLELKSADADYKIGVIDIPTFYADFAAYQAGDPNYKSTTRDVRRLLKELSDEDVDGVIIDLRNNGGGSLNEANALVGLFIKTGATVQVSGRNRDQVRVFKDSDPEVAYDGPLVVMVNRLSASASEIFAGAIQDYQRGVIVGGQTFGKGTVQTLLPLKRGQLKVTQAKFYRISGDSTQHQGVLPDIYLPTFIDLQEIGEDALEDALPWDNIRPVLHKKVGSVQPYVAMLNELHDERVKSDPDYQLRLSQIERLKENRAKTLISLNEQKRLKEQEEAKAWELTVENKRRMLKGLEPLAVLEEEEEETDEQAATPDKEPSSEENDPYLYESGHILVDFIRLSQQRIAGQVNP